MWDLLLPDYLLVRQPVVYESGASAGESSDSGALSASGQCADRCTTRSAATDNG